MSEPNRLVPPSLKEIEYAKGVRDHLREMKPEERAALFDTIAFMTFDGMPSEAEGIMPHLADSLGRVAGKLISIDIIPRYESTGN